VITSTPHEFDQLVPMAYMASRKGYVSQYHLKGIEDLGLVKLDVLGSKTLTVLKQCMDNLGWSMKDLDQITLKDRKTYSTLRTGETAGIFQLEGNSSKWGTKSLKPDRIEDVIAAMALFRPGVQRVKGDKHYIARKHGREPVPDRHELINKVTADTYGIMLYQEQVIDVLRALGMDADNLTAFLKAVKASNSNIGDAAAVIKGYQEWLREQMERVGMGAEDQKFLDEAIAGFAEYGFNRAHATVYGITAYRCAYLVTHHPLEFHAALLAVAANTDKEAQYLRAARARGVRVLQPSINISGPSYTVDPERGVIRRGLSSIKGIGDKSAEVLAKGSPYRDLDELVERVSHTAVNGWGDYDGSPESLTGTLSKLRDQGFLDLLITKQMEKNRAAV
jgi:DNA polymerase-3 subunit alpha